MATQDQIEARFWKALKSDMTVMLGLARTDGGKAQPMTAQIGDRQGRGPIWFFTARGVDLVQAMDSGARATLQFVSKGHDLFASLEGRLVPDNDRAKIDELWSPFAAA
jgi:general stress protein 26